MKVLSLRRLVKIASTSVLSLGLMAGAGAAEVTAEYDNGGRALFEIAVPDHWVLATGGLENYAVEREDKPSVPRVLGLRPENDNRIWVGFMSPDGVANVEQAATYIRNLDRRLVEDPKIDERKTTRIGGRTSTYFNGTGRRNGKSVHFTIGVIDLPANRVSIFVIAGENGARSLYRDELNAVIQSFRVSQ